jgi:hypothetical protein
MKEKRERTSRSTIEWLLMGGILTLFLWPLVQLMTIQAVPLIKSDTHQRAAIALENLMAKAQSLPYAESAAGNRFAPLPGGEDMGLEGMIEVMPHPNFLGMMLVRAHVRWGEAIWYKSLVLETAITQVRP